MNRFVRIFVICSIIFVTFTIISCSNIIYEKIYYKEIFNIEEQIVQKNDNILSATVLYDESDFWLEKKLRMVIDFKDGQWLHLSCVGAAGKYVKVEGINGYGPYFLRKFNDGRFNDGKIHRIIMIVIDFPEDDIIKNVTQIIRDFDVMASRMESLESIESDKYKDRSDEWLWSDEANLEKKVVEYYDQIEFKRPSEKPDWTKTQYMQRKEAFRKNKK